MRSMMKRSRAIQTTGMETEMNHDRRYRQYLRDLQRTRAFSRPETSSTERKSPVTAIGGR